MVSEGMNAAKPVISGHEVGCAADLVAHGQDGYVVESGDTEARGERLQTLTENPELARRMGDADLRPISG